MASQPLAFGQLLAGGVLVVAALTGASIREVVAGKAGPFKGFDIGGGSGATATTASTAPANTPGGIFIKKNLGRTDQGVDFTGTGAVSAFAGGTITRVDTNSGWPGGTLIAQLLDTPVQIGNRVYKYLYYAENITPNVHVGQRVKAGTQIATAKGGSPYTEQGFALNAQGVPYDHATYTEGKVTQAGTDFLHWIGFA